MFPWRNENKTVNNVYAFSSLKRPNYLAIYRCTEDEVEAKPIIYGAIIQSTTTNKYALVQGRSSGKWSFPKGHANVDESPFDCVCREIAEEIGCDKLPMPYTSFPLQVGYYYCFKVDNEFELKPRDTNEVCNSGWFTTEEIATMPVNVDINQFMKRLKQGV